MSTFGIVANIERTHSREAVTSTIGWLEAHGHEYYLDRKISALIGESDRRSGFSTDRFLERHELTARCDYILSLGGDGTMLATVRAVGRTEVPVIGINLGSLGFLTQQPEKALVGSLERIVAGDFKIDRRMVLNATTEPKAGEGNFFALNDFVIDRGSLSRLITINFYTDGDFVSSYRADGLIVATPTGSTAYNLAAGGPIVHPALNAIIVSPICPHTLTQRPLILSGDSILQMDVESLPGQASLTADGQKVFPLESGYKVIIKAADYKVNLIRFSDISFFDVLRQKLYLGRWPKIGI